MIDLLAYFIPVGMTAGVAGTGVLIKKAINVELRAAETKDALQAHIAADDIIAANLKLRLDDLRTEQRDQTEKLDRLVERLIK